MVLRAYIVPVATAPVGPLGASCRVPAYVHDQVGMAYRGIDYGMEDMFLVMADVTTVQHAAIAANFDAVSVPQNLQGTVGGTRATVQAALEARSIPGNWVTSGMTWRQVLRGVTTMFLVAQGLHGKGVRAIPPGMNLNTTIGELSAGARATLSQVVADLGWDASGVTLATTIREFLRLMAQQVTIPIRLGSETL